MGDWKYARTIGPVGAGAGDELGRGWVITDESHDPIPVRNFSRSAIGHGSLCIISFNALEWHIISADGSGA